MRSGTYAMQPNAKPKTMGRQARGLAHARVSLLAQERFEEAAEALRQALVVNPVLK